MLMMKFAKDFIMLHSSQLSIFSIIETIFFRWLSFCVSFSQKFLHPLKSMSIRCSLVVFDIAECIRGEGVLNTGH
jgi:hypothetical protein